MADTPEATPPTTTTVVAPEADQQHVVPAAEAESLSLGDRMKQYEAEMQRYLDRSLPFLVRLDGHGFSKFTRGFRKPFDDRIQCAMALTARDLMHEFRAATCYVASDEITLLFPPCAADSAEQIIYGGKVLKIVSLSAGFASARFNHYLQSQDYTNDEKLREKVFAAKAYFDSRVFTVSSGIECLNNLVWRVRDSRRNSKAMFGQSFFSAKQLHKLSSDEIINKVEVEKGERWSDLPGKYKSGVVLKKQAVTRDGVDHKTGQPVRVVRRQYVMTDWDSAMLQFDGENTMTRRDELVAYLFARTLDEEHSLEYEVLPSPE